MVKNYDGLVQWRLREYVESQARRQPPDAIQPQAASSSGALSLRIQLAMAASGATSPMTGCSVT